MGCWNGTCGISQLPIIAGMGKVKAFILVQNSWNRKINGSGSCYPTDYFNPFFLPVTAKYNDYGSIDNIQKDWNSDYMLLQFQEWLKSKQIKNLGDNAEINNPDIKKFEKLEDVFDCIERGALLYDGRKLGLFFVIESVWNELIKVKDPYDAYDTDSKKEWMRQVKCLKKIRSGKTGVEIEKFSISLMLRSIGDPKLEFGHYLDNICDSTFGEFDDIVTRIKEVHIMLNCMTLGRKLWFPQTGQGSQTADLGVYKAIIAGMLPYMKSLEDEEAKYA